MAIIETQNRSPLLDDLIRIAAVRREIESIKTDIEKIPLPACTEREKEMHSHVTRTIGLAERLADLEEKYEVLLSPPQRKEPGIDYFTIYFSNGLRRVIGGINIEDAYKRAKLNPNRIHTIEWCDPGVTVFQFDHKKKMWLRNKRR